MCNLYCCQNSIYTVHYEQEKEKLYETIQNKRCQNSEIIFAMSSDVEMFHWFTILTLSISVPCKFSMVLVQLQWSSS